MKRLIFTILLISSMFASFGQCADSTTLFFENFDGPTHKFRTSYILNPTIGDWYRSDTLFASPTKCFHSPVYSQDAAWSQAYIDTVRFSPGRNKIYLAFKHICKIHALDDAFIQYRYSVGGSASTGYQWSTWTDLTFTPSSTYYYGSATGTTIAGGRFNQNVYPEWQGSNNNAIPTNAWWKDELIEISSFVSGGDGQAFEIKFVVIQSSTANLPTGWFIDDVKLIASDKELISPKISLATPLVINNVNNYGPFTIKANVTDRPANNTIPDSVKLYYNENGGPYILAPKTILTPTQYSWTIPQQCNGNIVRYYITARDSACNPAIRLDTMFTVVMSTTGTTTNGVKAVKINNIPFSLEVGTPMPVSVIIKNRTNAPMTSASITMTVNNVPYPTYNWTNVNDFDPVRPFCLDFLDTVSIGSFNPVLEWDTVRVCITQRNGSPNNYYTSDSTCTQYIKFGCSAILSGPLTVGGTGANFSDINSFFTILRNCGMNGPIIAKLAPGTYSSSYFSFDSLFNGQSEINTLTFESSTGNPADVIIIDNGTNSNKGAVTFNGVKHFNLNKLTLQGKTGSTWSRGVYFTGNGNTNIKITNCIINVDNSNTTSNLYSGISRIAASTGTSGDSVEVRNNIINGGVYGIHFLGSAAKLNYISALDSNIINSTYYGIFSNYSNIGTVNKNQTTQSANSTQRYTGIHIERSTKTLSISKNKVFADVNLNVGLNLNNVSITNDSTIVTNNEIRGKATLASTYGINNTLCTNMKYIHNSIRLYSLVNLGVTACYYHTSGANIAFLNNLLVNDCLSLTNQNYPIYYQVNPTTLVSNFNVYHSDGPVGYYTVVRNTMSEWQYGLGGGKDTSSITTSPSFINPDISLKLTNYSGFECPQNPLVYDDIIDSLRSCEVTHMGCYSTYVPPKDLALTGLISPVIGTCPQTSYPITLKVFNFGCSTVNFANTPATIKTIATGGLTLNNTYTINTGTLAPNQFSNITINPGIAIPYNVNVNFTFIISYPGDERSNNDTMTLPFKLEVIAPALSVYDENFSNGTTLNWKIQQITGAGNWSFQEGIGTNPTIAPVYGTGRLYFNSKNFAVNTVSRITMPVMDLTNSVNPILEIWYAHDNTNSSNTYIQEGIIVKVSTNGGTTWTPIRPEIPNPTNTNDTILKRGFASITGYTLPAWVKYTYDLTPYATNSCVFISFEAKSKMGNNINIDRVRVRKIFNNDCSVQNIYTTQLRPTDIQTKPEIKALITNEGRNVQNNVQVTLSITGANTYTEIDTISAIEYNGQALATFNGSHLLNNGNNNIQITCQTDENNINNSNNAILITNTESVAYADTSNYHINFGSSTPVKVAVKYKVVDTLVVKSINFYPTNSLEMVGKRILAFISNTAGQIITTSDTITMTADMVNTWITIPLNNLALTSTSTEFYAGIEMIDPGYYLTAQYESPTRSETFYYLDSDAGTYTPQTIGRLMIGATLAPKIDRELAILSIINPISNCDLVVEPITIRIANNGPKDILPGVPFHYTINNGPVVTEIFNDTLFSHQIRSFSFNTTFDFTNHQINIDNNYSLKIWVNPVQTDIIRFNDTIQSLVVSKGKSFAPVVSDTIIVNYSTPGTLTAQLPTQINPGIIQWFTKVGNQYVGPLYQGPGPYITPNLIYYDTLYYVSVAPGVLYTPTVGTVSNSNNASPFSFSNGYSRGRILYKQSEIGNYGVISKIAINVHNIANGVLGIPIKIYIKQTDIDTLLSSDVFDWDNAIADATLVLDAQNYFNTAGWIELPIVEPLNYTSGNILIYTESNCGGTNCGTISGGPNYPTFKISTSANKVQSKTSNSTPNFTGTWGTATANRWVMKFYVADMTCASERVPVQLHIPDKPTYDVQTESFNYPVTMPQATQNCALYDEHIRVVYKNLLDKPIPANKVIAKAGFRKGSTGAYTWISHLITDSFAPLESKEVVFTQTYNFRAPYADTIFQFIATSDLVNESIVFRLNDTITGSIKSSKTVTIPDYLTYTGNFTETFNIAPGVPNVTIYYFYDSDTSTITIPGGNGVGNYTTTNLYDTAMYYMTAKTNNSPFCITKRIPITINVTVPTNNHDLKTNSLVYPTSYTCGLLNPTIVVNYNNTDSVLIPGSTFKVTAKFTGTTNVNVLDSIIVPFAAVSRLPITQPTFNVPFTKTAALGSILENRNYNYEIYTDAINPSYLPYRRNDTIRGNLRIPASPVAPANLTYNVPYGQPYTITPLSNTLNNGSPLNRLNFYDATGVTPLASGTSFTTPNIYAPTTYKYNGKIISIGFEKDSIMGNGSTPGALPFVFTNTESQGVVLYKKNELGGYAGYIDTIAVYINNNVTGSFPIQFYLKNTDSNTVSVGTYDWNNYFLNGATLIYNGTPTFNIGWFKIPIPGGFYYTGNNLMLLTSHNCFGESNLTALNIVPAPTFRFTNGASGLVIYRGGAYTGGSVAFSNTTTQRLNLWFSINYTCESPKSNITLTPTIPSVDLDVTNIITPVTPNNNYPANQTVSATIVNHGTSNANGFTVGYKFGNNPPVEQAFTGAIAPGASTNFTFSTPVDLSDVYFSHPFIVYVRHNLDLFHNNDTLRIQLKKDDPCAPIVVVGARDTIGSHISRFTFAGIDNGPGTPIFSCPASISGNGMFSDFTETVTPGFVVRGQSFPITIVNSFTTNSGSVLYKYVYLDMNRDNEFTPNEMIFSKLAVPSPTMANQTNATTTGFTNAIDINSETGLTRLRVITSSQALTGNIPCSALLNGEIEDYAVNIADPYPIDPGSTFVLHPSGNVCADTNAKIKVVIKNFGGTPLVLTPTEPLTVNAVVTGPVNSNYTIQITSGTVAQWDTIIATIHNVNLSAVGSYNIAINIQYTSDQFTINNIANSTCQVLLPELYTLPINVSFDSQTEYIAGAENPFPAFWTPTTTHTTFKWDVDSLGTTNAPQAGPYYDHSLFATGIQFLGQYAVVSAPANSSTAAIATLSTGCIDLHYKDGYPCEMSYWEHIFGAATATCKFYVEIGSGEYYIRMDSIIGRTHTGNDASISENQYSKRAFVMNQIDENARVRFVVTGRTGKIDPAIDDISILHGKADLAVMGFEYPVDFMVSTDDCVIKGDTIRPRVILKNVGRVPILTFNINFNAGIGTIIQTVPDELWTGILNPGETMVYQFNQGIVVPELFSYLQFQATATTINDEFSNNNRNTIVACTTVGIDDNLTIQNGIVLGQNIPNPATDNTKIPFYTTVPGKTELRIHSAEGQLLFSTTIDAEYGDNNIEINTANWASGIYFYTIYLNNTQLTRKMLIQK